MAKLIYLASPYTHTDPKVMQHRADTAARVAASLMKRGMMVFSPIAHSHALAIAGELPRDWKFWAAYCRETLGRCDEMLIIPMFGYKDSTGINEEIKIAGELGIPVSYMQQIRE